MHPVGVVDNVFIEQLTGDVHLAYDIAKGGVTGGQVDTLDGNDFSGVNGDGLVDLGKGTNPNDGLHAMSDLIVVIGESSW